MSEKVKVGVVGVGHLGRRHAQILARAAQANLVGVYDLDQKKTQRIAQECDAAAFDSLDSLLDSVDAVTVVVPTVAHHEVAAAALANGTHVFIEKPISTTLAEADELIQLAKKAGVILQVGHIERFNPAVRALAGIDLQPMFIESHRLSPFDPRGTDVAVVLDLMIHDIDLILSLVKSPVQRIDANGVSVVSSEIDIANARIQFANGCVANVTSSRISQKKMRKMRLFQPNAYISIDFLQGMSEIFRLASTGDPSEASPVVLGQIDAGARPRQIVYERPTPPEGDPLQLELESFLRAVRSEAPPPVSGEDGRRALEVAIAINEEIHQHALNQR
jgi:predicted dehydrogenase